MVFSVVLVCIFLGLNFREVRLFSSVSPSPTGFRSSEPNPSGAFRLNRSPSHFLMGGGYPPQNRPPFLADAAAVTVRHLSHIIYSLSPRVAEVCFFFCLSRLLVRPFRSPPARAREHSIFRSVYEPSLSLFLRRSVPRFASLLSFLFDGVSLPFPKSPTRKPAPHSTQLPVRWCLLLSADILPLVIDFPRVATDFVSR